MATQIKFDFEPWNPRKDFLLRRPGTQLGFTAINNGMNPGVAPTVNQADADELIGGSVDGVIQILAGAVQWLRFMGFTPEEVEQKVRVYTNTNLSNIPAIEKAIAAATVEISDPDNLAGRTRNNLTVRVAN